MRSWVLCIMLTNIYPFSDWSNCNKEPLIRKSSVHLPLGEKRRLPSEDLKRPFYCKNSKDASHQHPSFSGSLQGIQILHHFLVTWAVVLLNKGDHLPSHSRLWEPAATGLWLQAHSNKCRAVLWPWKLQFFFTFPVELHRSIIKLWCSESAGSSKTAPCCFISLPDESLCWDCMTKVPMDSAYLSPHFCLHRWL